MRPCEHSLRVGPTAWLSGAACSHTFRKRRQAEQVGGAVRVEAAAGPRARRTAYICYGTGGHYRLTRECGTEGSRVEASAREASTRNRDERSGDKATRRRLPGHTHSSRLRTVKQGPGVRTLPELTRHSGADNCGRNLGKPKRCHPRLAVLCCGVPDGRHTACTMELHNRRGQHTVVAFGAQVRIARRTQGKAGSTLLNSEGERRQDPTE